jgi:hypothetical protein
MEVPKNKYFIDRALKGKILPDGRFILPVMKIWHNLLFKFIYLWFK